jgi:hypothetical protein
VLEGGGELEEGQEGKQHGGDALRLAEVCHDDEGRRKGLWKNKAKAKAQRNRVI